MGVDWAPILEKRECVVHPKTKRHFGQENLSRNKRGIGRGRIPENKRSEILGEGDSRSEPCPSVAFPMPFCGI